MSATEVIEEIKKLPSEQQKEVFVFLAGNLIARQGPGSKQRLGQKLTFDEACDVVFRENRELFGLFAQ